MDDRRLRLPADVARFDLSYSEDKEIQSNPLTKE